ncbi:LOW QUALITY PROTEIN: NF-kappa-B inhibitor-interacting Ras-like protein 2 [Salvelinus sp. IW2-2015]|uniref:LOW QUALITY PROTEIN: NF-kappa-B inhibitor-interacting Ras-like protein 2 n=1 Tax=Salvelinus sp. IW2-2015 TaxID=2691554 RepID=UPI000CDFAAFF|nr:LOW QUALITY PROTEIN: NF-kappa-B inhibitor-interacting Ras-like protein 2 [Salvelinus alpinus]
MGKSCKVVVCGLAAVGKTAVLEQLLYANHIAGSEPMETLEDIYIGSIETDRGTREQVTIVVLGNKLDMQEQRRVDSEVAQHWAKTEKVRLWEVSVADRRTLIEPFVHLASKMTQPQSKSSFPLSRNKNKGSGSVDS